MPELGSITFGPAGTPRRLLEEAATALESQTRELARLREETRWRKPEEEEAPVKAWVETWTRDADTGEDFWTPALWDGEWWYFSIHQIRCSSQVVLRWRPAPSRPADLPEMHGPAEPNARTSEPDARSPRTPAQICAGPAEQGARQESTWRGEVCKRCLRRNTVGFHVPEEVWIAVSRDRWNILCLTCFDEEAEAAGVRYELGEVWPVTWASRQEVIADA